MLTTCHSHFGAISLTCWSPSIISLTLTLTFSIMLTTCHSHFGAISLTFWSPSLSPTPTHPPGAGQGRVGVRVHPQHKIFLGGCLGVLGGGLGRSWEVLGGDRFSVPSFKAILNVLGALWGVMGLNTSSFNKPPWSKLAGEKGVVLTMCLHFCAAQDRYSSLRACAN